MRLITSPRRAANTHPKSRRKKPAAENQKKEKHIDSGNLSKDGNVPSSSLNTSLNVTLKLPEKLFRFNAASMVERLHKQ